MGETRGAIPAVFGILLKMHASLLRVQYDALLDAHGADHQLMNQNAVPETWSSRQAVTGC